jgi:hypothetical protein
MVDALTDITIAAKRAQGEPFIQRTAAHLLAWYDNVPTQPALPTAVQRSLKDIPANLGASQVFTEAYRNAGDYYREERRLAAGSTTRPTTGPTTGPSSGPTASSQQYPPPGDYPEYGGYGGYGGSDVAYGPYIPAPYYPPYSSYSSYDNGYPYYSPYCWYPGYGFYPAVGFGFFEVFDFDRHRHHHDFDDDDRHGRGRGRDNDHDADDRFRDRFFGSSHRLGTATGRHLRDLQHEVNANPPIVTRHSVDRSGDTANPSVTHITPSRAPGRVEGRSDGGASYGHTGSGFVPRNSGGSHYVPSSPSSGGGSGYGSGHSYRGGDGSSSAPPPHSAPAPSHSDGGSSHSSGSSSGSSGSSGGGAAVHGHR